MAKNDPSKLFLKFVEAIADTIKDAGDNGVPSGHLYAMLMSYMTLETYIVIIQRLKNQGRIKESNCLLTYIGK